MSGTLRIGRASGTLRIVGTGPGDPELLTLKAARILAASRVVAYVTRRGGHGQARRIVDAHLPPSVEELRLEYPYTTELPPAHPAYRAAMAAFHDAAAASLAARLADGADVALLCEGDPMLYGSSIHLMERLSPRFPVEVVPGISAMSGCWSRAALPIARGSGALLVLPATLGGAGLASRLAGGEACVIMKAGRHLPEIAAALAEAGRQGALLVERGTMPEERIAPLAGQERAPYFSLVLVPAA